MGCYHTGPVACLSSSQFYKVILLEMMNNGRLFRDPITFSSWGTPLQSSMQECIVIRFAYTVQIVIFPALLRDIFRFKVQLIVSMISLEIGSVLASSCCHNFCQFFLTWGFTEKYQESSLSCLSACAFLCFVFGLWGCLLCVWEHASSSAFVTLSSLPLGWAVTLLACSYRRLQTLTLKCL